MAEGQPTLVGHGPDLEDLLGAAAAGRLGHALLVTGPPGIGKFALLEELARGLLCDRGPAPACGQCPACRRVVSGAHPDLHRVDPLAEGFAELTIHFIAERENRPSGAFSGVAVESFLRLVAGEGGWRIVPIRDADRMNEETQNALLKTLEEPGPGVLLAMESAGRPPCSPRFEAAWSSGGCGGWTAARSPGCCGGRSRSREGSRLVRLADGAPGRAVALEAAGARESLDLLGRAFAGRAGAPALVKALLEVEGDFPGRTDRARERERVRLLLDLGLELVRDLQRAAAGAPLTPSPTASGCRSVSPRVAPVGSGSPRGSRRVPTST